MVGIIAAIVVAKDSIHNRRVRSIVGDLMTEGEEGTRAGSPEHFIYADCTSRAAAELMATQGLSVLPVKDRATGQITGEITLLGLLQARRKSITREQDGRASSPPNLGILTHDNHRWPRCGRA